MKLEFYLDSPAGYWYSLMENLCSLLNLLDARLTELMVILIWLLQLSRGCLCLISLMWFLAWCLLRLTSLAGTTKHCRIHLGILVLHSLTCTLTEVSGPADKVCLFAWNGIQSASPGHSWFMKSIHTVGFSIYNWMLKYSKNCKLVTHKWFLYSCCLHPIQKCSIIAAVLHCYLVDFTNKRPSEQL